MKKNYLLPVALSFFFFQAINAQDTIPLLTGKVTLSIKQGTLDCDFTLSNIPRLGDYYIRINSGMNIRYFRNPVENYLIYYDKSFHDTLSSGETNAYYFPSNNRKGKFLPKTIQFKYIGKYPVFPDTSDYSVEDWKGNIAFNGYSVRTDGSQAAWYPVLYDIKKDLKYDNLKYDIEITCADCNTIYVNGSLPVKGTYAHLKSDIPQQLTMYSGNYEIKTIGSTYFLNPDISEQEIKEFGELTNSYKKYYEKNLGIPYKQAITYIQTTPTSERNAWLFVSYPTIVNIGRGQYGMKSFFDKRRGASFKPYIAHELGHYYFGSYKRFNSELGDMMSEGFSEFLSLKIAKNLVNDSIYNKKVADKLRSLQGFDPIPFGKIKAKSEYDNRELYVYYYAPLLFLAIEKEIGEPAMWKWLKNLLETPTDFTNYAFLEQTLSTALQDPAKLELIKSKYFNSDKALENARVLLEQK